MPLPVFTPITLAHHDFVGLLDQYVRTSLVSDLPATRLPHCSRETGGPQSTSGALQPPMEASLPELRVNTWIFSRRPEPSESERATQAICNTQPRHPLSTQSSIRPRTGLHSTVDRSLILSVSAKGLRMSNSTAPGWQRKVC